MRAAGSATVAVLSPQMVFSNGNIRARRTNRISSGHVGGGSVDYADVWDRWNSPPNKPTWTQRKTAPGKDAGCGLFADRSGWLAEIDADLVTGADRELH